MNQPRCSWLLRVPDWVWLILLLGLVTCYRLAWSGHHHAIPSVPSSPAGAVDPLPITPAC
jgi:hypothetical protein